jgi:CelD/BcsL family acetyltransferase involved in cellulose biosynthesis
MLPAIPAMGLISYTTRRLRVDVVTDFNSFLNLKQVWDLLVSEAALDHPFVTHEWIRAWWESFGGNRTMHIVVVREGETVVGIAPMLEDTERFYGFKLRKLTFIWNSHVPRCDFIVAGRRLDVYRALWDYIASQGKRWDLLLLPQLPENSPTLTWFKELATAGGYLACTWSADASPYVPISGTWEDYFESLPQNHRSNLHSRAARLASVGTVELEPMSGEAGDVRTALDEGFQIEAAAGRVATGSAVIADAGVRMFYSKLVQNSGIRNLVRLQFLRAGSKRIAFNLSLQYASSMYLIKGSHLPEYSAYSPFNILASKNLEHCFREGLQRYDFLGKEEEWKSRWSRRALSHHWMFIYPDNPRTALFNAMKFRLAPMMQKFGQVEDSLGKCAMAGFSENPCEAQG